VNVVELTRPFVAAVGMVLGVYMVLVHSGRRDVGDR
jgi:hypothetical protein